MSTHDDKFDEIVENFIQVNLKYNPTLGTHLGLHEWDTLSPDLSEDAVIRFIHEIESILKKLESIDESKLSSDRLIDYLVLLNHVKESLIYLKEWPLWRMFPAGASALGDLIFPLVINEYLPKEHRALALVSRLKSIDNYLGASIKAVKEPYSLWMDLASALIAGSSTLLDSVASFGEKEGYEDVTESALKAKEKIEHSLKELMNLKEKAAPGFRPLGKELFSEVLRLRFIEEDIEKLKKQGYTEAKKYRSLIMDAAEELGINNIVEALKVVESVRSYSVESFIELYSGIIDRVKAFVKESGIIDLPRGEKILLTETPDFLKPIIPFAAYMPPEAFSPYLKGIYFVTPPKSDDGLRHSNFYSIINTAVHEAYPGHHTQLTTAKVMAHPLRLLFSPADFVEGWAHYVEELMLEAGIDSSPHYRIKVWHDALWRAVRVYLDIELHTEDLKFNDAVEKLSRDAYIPRSGAVGEVLRYTISPTYQLSYNYGKTKIKQLRKEVKKILGTRYSHKLFHRLLLEEGNLPINILYRLVIKKAKQISQHA